MQISRNSYFRAAVLLMAVATLSGCGANMSTPQACFEEFKAASKAKDIARSIECLSKEDQRAMTGVFLTVGTGFLQAEKLGSAFGGGNHGKQEQIKAATAKINAVFEKHGITQDSMEGISLMSLKGDAAQKAVEEIQNPSGFIKDMVEVMEDSGPKDNFFSKHPAMNGNLVDVTIEGDKARGFVELEGNQKVPIAFVKESSEWKISSGLGSQLSKLGK